MSSRPRNKVRIMNGSDTAPAGYSKKDVKVVTKDGAKRFVWRKKSNNSKKNPWALAVKKAYANLKRSGDIVKGTFEPLVKSGKLYKEAMRIHSPRGRKASPRKTSKCKSHSRH
jgi:hypothetical protein